MKKILLLFLALNLIFITPHIVYSDEKLDPGTKALSESFKNLSQDQIKKIISEGEKYLKFREDYNMSIDKEFQIRKNVLNCADENISDKQKIIWFKEGNELLTFYSSHFNTFLLKGDIKKYVQVLVPISYCAKNEKLKKKYINLVRFAVDQQYFNLNLTKKILEDVYTTSLALNYSRYVESVDTSSKELQWIYDKNLLNFFNEKKTDIERLSNLSSYLIFSDERFSDNFFSNKVIDIIQPSLENYKPTQLDLQEYSHFFSLTRNFIKLLIASKKFDECNEFYKKKLSNLKLPYKKLPDRINFLDFEIQCSIGVFDIETASILMKNKSDLIRDGLNNFKYNKEDEERLYDNLIRAELGTASLLKMTGVEQSDYLKAEQIIKDAEKLNYDYYFKTDIWGYLTNQLKFIKNDFEEGRFIKAENKMKNAMVLIESVKRENYPYNSYGDWEKAKKVLRASYLEVYASLFANTGRYQESINLYEKFIKANGDELYEHHNTRDISKIRDTSLNALNQIVAYFNLLKVYEKLADEKNYKKYLKILYNYCEKKSVLAPTVCPEVYQSALTYYAQAQDLEKLKKAKRDLELYYDNKTFYNFYHNYMVKAAIYHSELRLYLTLASNPDEKQNYDKLKREACDSIEKFRELNNKMGDFIQGKTVSQDFNFRYKSFTLSDFFLDIGLECGFYKNDLEIALKTIDGVINLHTEKINQLVKIPGDFYKYNIGDSILSEMVGVTSYYKEFFPNDIEKLNKRLKKLFYLTQFGKNYYLTSSIKRALNEEIVINSELKNLINKKNKLQNEIDHHTKNLFKVDNERTDFRKTNDLEFQIQNINLEIKNKFPKYIEKTNSDYFTVNKVQKLLKENETLIVFDSARFLTAHIIKKERYDTFHDTRINSILLDKVLRTLKKSSDPQSINNNSLELLKKDLNLAYETIFKSLENKIANSEKIVVIADQIFEDFPIGLLFDKANNKYLAEKYSISYYPSIGSLVNLRSNKISEELSASSKFLGIGDPYLSKKSRSKYLASLSDFSFNSRGILKDASIIDKKFNKLPYSKDEIVNLSKFFQTSTLLLNKEANEENIKKIDMKKFDIISFATHASVSGTLEGFNEPFLVLTPPSKTTIKNDGILSASEVSNLNIKANIVILSACNTASKENEYAPGFSGLVAAFFKAGAKNVLATHWPISDKATSIMVNEIIDKKIKKKMEYSSAMRETKKEFIQGKYGKKYQNPAYWASYVIIGD